MLTNNREYMIPLLAKTTAEEIPGISKEDVKSIFIKT